MVRPGIATAVLALAMFGLGWGARALSTARVAGIGPGPTAPSALSSAAAPRASVSAEGAFTDIYKNARWGTNGGDAGASGYGSTVQAARLYHAFLQQFMKDVGIHSVVDAGCGDWESTQTVDWTGIDYKGYDIVASVVEADQKKFGKPNVHFYQANIVEADLPEADLLICKQVLQHLPNDDIQKFLKKLGRYKHVLLVDAVNPGTLSGKNRDIGVGEFRELDLTRAPFSLSGTKVLTYWDGGNMEQVIHLQR